MPPFSFVLYTAGQSPNSVQTLVNGASCFDEPGVFVAFEECSESLLANSYSFEWPLAELDDEKLCFLDAMPPVEAVAVGEFAAVPAAVPEKPGRGPRKRARGTTRQPGP